MGVLLLFTAVAWAASVPASGNVTQGTDPPKAQTVITSLLEQGIRACHAEGRQSLRVPRLERDERHTRCDLMLEHEAISTLIEDLRTSR